MDHYSTHRVRQVDGLDKSGSPGASSGAIEVELVQGKREEMYWEKVPEKVRRQALEKAAAGKQSELAVGVQTMDDSSSNSRKQKRRKRD